MFCPKCGAELKEGAKFCHKCGFNMSETPVTPPPPQQQQQPPQQQSQPQNPFQNFNEAEVKAAASNIFSRASNIMFKTKSEWQAISAEKPSASSILFGYAIPLALIPAIFSIIGYGVIGVSYGWGFKFTSWIWGIEVGLTSFISAIAGVYITALIVDALAPAFKGQKSFGRAMQ
ncbi:MAG: zinc-ribbon domain-containing protein, partial [Bacteroidales bacterium]